MRWTAAGLLIVVAGAGVYLAWGPGGGDPVWIPGEPEAAHPHGERYALAALGGRTLLVLRGTPRQQGLAHGALLGPRIRGWVERVKPPEGLGEFVLDTCGRQLWRRVPDPLRREIEGIAEGAGVTPFQVLHLHARFELKFIDGLTTTRGGRFSGPCAVGPGREVVRWIRPVDLNGDLDELILVMREGERSSLFVGLPGLAGGFVGARAGCVAAFAPAEVEATPSLDALSWPLFLRLIVESPPMPGQPLPARPTLLASVTLSAWDLGAGTLAVGPPGAGWYPAAGGYAAALEASHVPAGAEVRRLGLAARAEREWTTAARRALAGTPAKAGLAVGLRATPEAVDVTFRGPESVRTLRLPLK